MIRGYREPDPRLVEDVPVTENVYATDLASIPRGDGIRDLEMTDRWNTPAGRPNGGYILATMLTGLASEMSPEGAPLAPRVAAITYHGPPSNGAAEMRCTPIRSGRTIQTGDASLWQDDRLIAQLTASFGPRFGGRPSVELGTPPALPDPESLPDPRGMGAPSGGIFDRVDYRLTAPPGFLTGQPTKEPVYELWQRRSDGQVADYATLAFLCDSFIPPIFELGPDVAQASLTVQLTVHLHRLPTSPWVATRLRTQHVIDGFHEEDCELWDADGHLLAQSRQLAIIV